MKCLYILLSNFSSEKPKKTWLLESKTKTQIHYRVTSWIYRTILPVNCQMIEVWNLRVRATNICLENLLMSWCSSRLYSIGEILGWSSKLLHRGWVYMFSKSVGIQRTTIASNHAITLACYRRPAAACGRHPWILKRVSSLGQPGRAVALSAIIT